MNRRWQLHCTDGNIREHCAGVRLPYNPQHPPPEWGHVKQIRMLNGDGNDVVVTIPLGATPVCFRRRGATATSLCCPTTIAEAVGFSLDGTKYIWFAGPDGAITFSTEPDNNG